MSPATATLVLVFLVAGASLGWSASRAHAAHGDVKSTKAKIPGYRKSRHRNGIKTIILAFVIGFIIVSMISGGHHHH